MTFTFLDMSGATLFLRDDAERADWTQEEMTLNVDFPYDPGKVVTIGQRIYFRDPSTGEAQVYEIKQAKTTEPDSGQQVVAENICISELSDEHMDNRDIENATASDTVGGILSGTLWAVGRVTANPVSSVNLTRGSVWQAVLQIRQNFNVYIEPRVTVANDGTITRFLDIKGTAGEWNGVRLSVNKNFLDPSVTYDDSELYTAMFGYGGTEIATQQGEESKEIDFSSVVWSATSEHPAKPAGQKYIELPSATAAYGRNGRARFGYYQNTDITNPEILLEKTWETLKNASTPAVSIEGTVADLYRMGYADQPIKLHDIAIVDVEPIGFHKQLQVIQMTTNLLDFEGSTVTIGAYIPNIIYIEKRTNEGVTGSAGGGGGNSNKAATERHEFETAIEANNEMIRLRAYQNDLDDLDNEVKLQEGRITVEHNRISAEVTDRRNADMELAGRITVEANRITAEVTERTRADDSLSGRITVESNKIALVVTEDHGAYKVNTASIVAGINAQSGSFVEIQADKIDLSGYVTVSEFYAVDAKIDNLMSGRTNASQLNADSLWCGSFSYGSYTYTEKPVRDIYNNIVYVMGRS